MPDDQSGNPGNKPSGHHKYKWIARGVSYLERKLQERRSNREKENAADRAARRTADATWVIVFLTIVIMAVGFLQWRSMQGQLKEMRSSGDDTKNLVKAAQDSAKAAQDAVDLNKQTSEKMLRAYLSIEGISCALEGNEIIVQVGLRNSGQTPAHKVTAETHVAPVMADSFVATMRQAPHLNSGHMVIGHNTVFWVHVRYVPVDTSDGFIAEIKKNTSSLMIYGSAEYEDIFGKTHKLVFNLRGTGFDGSKWQLTPEQYGNEAD